MATPSACGTKQRQIDERCPAPALRDQFNQVQPMGVFAGVALGIHDRAMVDVVAGRGETDIPFSEATGHESEFICRLLECGPGSSNARRDYVRQAVYDWSTQPDRDGWERASRVCPVGPPPEVA